MNNYNIYDSLVKNSVNKRIKALNEKANLSAVDKRLYRLYTNTGKYPEQENDLVDTLCFLINYFPIDKNILMQDQSVLLKEYNRLFKLVDGLTSNEFEKDEIKIHLLAFYAYFMRGSSLKIDDMKKIESVAFKLGGNSLEPKKAIDSEFQIALSKKDKTIVTQKKQINDLTQEISSLKNTVQTLISNNKKDRADFQRDRDNFKREIAFLKEELKKKPAITSGAELKVTPQTGAVVLKGANATGFMNEVFENADSSLSNNYKSL